MRGMDLSGLVYLAIVGIVAILGAVIAVPLLLILWLCGVL